MLAVGPGSELLNDQIIGGVKHDTNTTREVNAGNCLCDGVLAEVSGWVKTLMLLLKVVANRSPALLKARFSTEVEVPFLNVADAEAEPVTGALKIEMLPPMSPTATLPAESTARAPTLLAEGTERVAVGVGVAPVRGNAN